MCAVDIRQATASANANATSSRPKLKEKEKEKEKKSRSSQKSQGERFKTVVRKLPPNLPEEIFWQSVQPWVTDETTTWKVYHQGKFRKRLNKENIPSRAYIAFKNEQTLATFSREYDGHLFKDKAGNESIAIVEFAPFQKVPSEKKKVDGRLGTIEKDEDYLSFVESLKEGSNKPFDIDSLESLAAASQPPPQPTTTPLLEALKAEKSAQKDKETILRAHAHYKDPAIAASASASKKDDGTGKGKRGAAANIPPKAAEAASSKKAAKAAAKAQQQAESANSNAPSGPGAPNPKKIVQNANGQAPAGAKPVPPAKAAPKSPRRPHRERERQEPKATGASSSGPPAGQPSDTAPTKSPPAQPGATLSPATASGASATAAPPPSRRARPTLGLASRHFEAALSGAGVERKSRKERERERENKEGSEQSPVGGTPATTNKDAATQGLAPTILARPAQASSAQDPPFSGVGREDGGTGGRGGGGRGRRGRGRGGVRGG